MARRFTVLLLCALLLAGCLPPTPQPADTPTAPPADTPTAVMPTPESSPTAAASPTSGPALSEMPHQMVWLAAGQQVEGIPSPGPLLIARIGSTLYPFQPDPIRAEPPVTLNIPGSVLALSPDLRSVIASSAEGSLSVYNLAGNLLFSIDASNPYGAGYTEDGKTITVTSQNEWAILVYDAATGQRIKKLTGFETAAPVYNGGLVPGGKTAYWIARATLRLQDVESGQMGAEFHYVDFIGPLAFSQDGSRMALNVSGKIFLYAVPQGTELAQITVSQPVNSLAFSPDGSLLSAGYGPGVEIWDGNTLAPRSSIPGPNAFTGQVIFSPDGTYLAAAHEGGQITILRVPGGP